MLLSHDIITTIKSLPSPTIIAISGFGGSGKSILANTLGTDINASVVCIDSFMKPGAFDTKYHMWNIMDFERLETEVLKPFTINQHITYGHFDPKENRVTKTKEILNSKRIIVEGVGLFRPNLLKYFNYKIWINCPIELAIARGKKRDREEYGSPTDELWEGLWKRNDLECYKEYDPTSIADYIVNQNQQSI